MALLLGLLGVACGSSQTSGDGASPEPCEGGLCASPDGAAPTLDGGSPTKACSGDDGLSQIKGDCKKNLCDPNGAIVAVADDGDVATSTSECTESTCSGGKPGSAPKVAGTACSGGKCDGKGACVQSLGDTCAANSDCASGFCVDGVCCDTACRGECQACNVAGSVGVCSNIPYDQPDKSFERDGNEGSCDILTAGARCNGAGKCLKISGTQCNQNDQCMSNQCALLTTQKCLGAKGEACFNNVDCVSGKCKVGTCE